MPIATVQQQPLWVGTTTYPLPTWSAGAVMPVSFVLTGRVINSVGSNPLNTQRLIEQVDQVSATYMQRLWWAVAVFACNQQNPNACLCQLASCCLTHRLRCNAAPSGPDQPTSALGHCQHWKNAPPFLQACLFMVYLAIVAIFASSLEVIPWMVTGRCSPPAPAAAWPACC